MKNEILKIEEDVRIAQLAQNTDFFENILADDFKFITPQGKIVTKREDIDQYKSGYLRLKNADIEDRTIDIHESTKPPLGAHDRNDSKGPNPLSLPNRRSTGGAAFRVLARSRAALPVSVHRDDAGAT
jgi:hypothetical protein